MFVSESDLEKSTKVLQDLHLWTTILKENVSLLFPQQSLLMWSQHDPDFARDAKGFLFDTS